MSQARSGTFWVVVSFVLAFIMSMLPLPTVLNTIRPVFVLLVLIYWVIALPHRYGIATAFVVGLALDVMTGKMLGLNALLMSLIAFIAARQYSRLRMFTRPMQAFFVLLMTGIALLLQIWIENAVQPIAIRSSYWLPALSSGIAWFVVFPVLRFYRRRLHIS